jgi:dipeptidyl aminopeptidase/acylaminoacyl peptidase
MAGAKGAGGTADGGGSGVLAPKPFGLWPSPISARSLAAGRGFRDVAWDDDGETLVWLEGRGDRGVLVAGRVGSGDAPRDLSDDQSVRAKVGYGGGDFTVGRGAVWFVNAADGRLWRQSLAGGRARPVTPAGGLAASPKLSPCGGFVAYVHHDEDGADRIAVVEAHGGWPQVLAQGADFYTQPRWSPDGRHFAWVEWQHPRMPWDGAELRLARIEKASREGSLPQLTASKVVAGGPDEAVFQPEFGIDSKTLYFVTDASGWWHIHAVALADDGSVGTARAVTKGTGAEFGLPNWVQEMRTYALAPDGKRAFAALNKNAFVSLVEVDLDSGAATALAPLAGYTDAAQLAVAPKSGRLALVGSGPTQPPRVVCFDGAREGTHIVARATAESLLPSEMSTPVAVSFPTAKLEEAHGLFYPPAGAKVAGHEGNRPPLIVIVHGGPTSQVRAGWSAQAQYFATRGWAVLYVNHRGGTGYGRQFMLKLRGAWGKVDVEDSVFGARWLAETGKVDAARMAIMGGSAGGYTVLQTMVDQPEVFAAGVALYGIANQFTLAQGTHKFEAHYNDSLLGALPDAAPLWRERSPVFHAARIKRPLAIFQGAVDNVVPKDQAEAIVAALKRGGTPHLYQVYEGEGHGWRKPETIEHFYKAVESFLGEHLLFR